MSGPLILGGMCAALGVGTTCLFYKTETRSKIKHNTGTRMWNASIIGANVGVGTWCALSGQAPWAIANFMSAWYLFTLRLDQEAEERKYKKPHVCGEFCNKDHPDLNDTAYHQDWNDM